MRSPNIHQLNKAFESRVRLGIMSVLMVNDSIDFNSIKDLLKVTDGNLASHIKPLEAHEYITVRKQFVGNAARLAPIYMSCESRREQARLFLIITTLEFNG